MTWRYWARTSRGVRLSITTVTGSGSSQTSSTGPPIPGNLPTMDSGTSDGGTDQELARLANFMTGGNENPTSTQPAATPRSVQAAIPLLPTGSPAATAISNPEGRDTIGDVMNDQGTGTWTPYGNPLYQPPGEASSNRGAQVSPYSMGPRGYGYGGGGSSGSASTANDQGATAGGSWGPGTPSANQPDPAASLGGPGATTDPGPGLYEGYWTEVGKTLYGEGKSVVNTATGLWSAIWHPITTAQNVGSAVWNYDKTAATIKNAVVEGDGNRDAISFPPIVLKGRLLKLITPSHGYFGMSRSVVLEQNERLLDQWQELPKRVQDEVLTHLRHYVHATLGVSWLTGSTSGVSALPSISWRRQPVSLALQKTVDLPGLESPLSASVDKLLDRLKLAITELGYDAVIEDLSSSDLVGGEDSLLGSEDVMVIPGYLEDAARPILLAATKGWSGNTPRSFAKIMRQVKARLIEANGATQVVIVFCDCWDSASFEEEHRQELRAFDKNGIRFMFFLVGVPDKNLIPVPVGFDRAEQ
jgi:hypothetical protein